MAAAAAEPAAPSEPPTRQPPPLRFDGFAAAALEKKKALAQARAQVLLRECALLISGPNATRRVGRPQASQGSLAAPKTHNLALARSLATTQVLAAPPRAGPAVGSKRKYATLIEALDEARPHVRRRLVRASNSFVFISLFAAAHQSSACASLLELLPCSSRLPPRAVLAICLQDRARQPGERVGSLPRCGSRYTHNARCVNVYSHQLCHFSPSRTDIRPQAADLSVGFHQAAADPPRRPGQPQPPRVLLTLSPLVERPGGSRGGLPSASGADGEEARGSVFGSPLSDARFTFAKRRRVRLATTVAASAIDRREDKRAVS